MSDPSEESLDPAETAVRDLLASARGSGPVPDDVAARLDARLAELVAERDAGVPELAPRGAGTPAQGSRSPSARRRRSRVAGALLGAAAAVVVGGVALTQVPGLGPGAGSSGDSAITGGEESAREGAHDGASGPEDLDEPLDGAEDGADEGAEGGAEGQDEGGGEGADGGPSGQPAPVATVSSATLVEDLVAVRAALGDGPGGTASGRPSPGSAPGASLCLPPTPLGPGAVTVAVLWDGAPAVVVLEPAGADGQAAQVRTCGSRPRVQDVVLPLAP